jgi:hypothetical protein
MIPVGERTPNFQEHLCQECNNVIWTFCSRALTPKSYTLAQFEEEFQIHEDDDGNKSISPLNQKFPEEHKEKE